MYYVKLQHNTKIDTIKSKYAHLHIQIIEKLFFKFNAIYKNRELTIDNIIDNVIEKGIDNIITWKK